LDATWPAFPVAVLVLARETINADDQPSCVVFNATRCLLSLPGGVHARFLTCREASARPIHALCKGAGTGLPAYLLGSKCAGAFCGVPV
jgi:hypothetical protein